MHACPVLAVLPCKRVGWWRNGGDGSQPKTLFTVGYGRVEARALKVRTTGKVCTYVYPSIGIGIMGCMRAACSLLLGLEDGEVVVGRGWNVGGRSLFCVFKAQARRAVRAETVGGVCMEGSR